MTWLWRYIVSTLPLAVIGGGVLLAEWAVDRFGCVALGKELLPCLVGASDISPLLGIGLFWFKLLLPVAWMISVPWLIFVAISHAVALRRRSSP